MNPSEFHLLNVLPAWGSEDAENLARRLATATSEAASLWCTSATTMRIMDMLESLYAHRCESPRCVADASNETLKWLLSSLRNLGFASPEVRLWFGEFPAQLELLAKMLGTVVNGDQGSIEEARHLVSVLCSLSRDTLAVQRFIGLHPVTKQCLCWSAQRLTVDHADAVVAVLALVCNICHKCDSETLHHFGKDVNVRHWMHQLADVAQHYDAARWWLLALQCLCATQEARAVMLYQPPSDPSSSVVDTDCLLHVAASVCGRVRGLTGVSAAARSMTHLFQGMQKRRTAIAASVPFRNAWCKWCEELIHGADSAQDDSNAHQAVDVVAEVVYCLYKLIRGEAIVENDGWLEGNVRTGCFVASGSAVEGAMVQVASLLVRYTTTHHLVRRPHRLDACKWWCCCVAILAQDAGSHTPSSDVHTSFVEGNPFLAAGCCDSLIALAERVAQGDAAARLSWCAAVDAACCSCRGDALMAFCCVEMKEALHSLAAAADTDSDTGASGAETKPPTINDNKSGVDGDAGHEALASSKHVKQRWIRHWGTVILRLSMWSSGVRRLFIDVDAQRDTLKLLHLAEPVDSPEESAFCSDPVLPLLRFINLANADGHLVTLYGDNLARKVIFSKCAQATLSEACRREVVIFLNALLSHDVTQYQLELGSDEAFLDTVCGSICHAPHITADRSVTALGQWISNFTARCDDNILHLLQRPIVVRSGVVAMCHSATTFESIRWTSAAICNLTTRNLESQTWAHSEALVGGVITMGKQLISMQQPLLLTNVKDVTVESELAAQAARDAQIWFTRVLNNTSFFTPNQKLFGCDESLRSIIVDLLPQITALARRFTADDEPLQWACSALQNYCGSLPEVQLRFAAQRGVREGLIISARCVKSPSTAIRWLAALASLASRLIGTRLYFNKDMVTAIERVALAAMGDEASTWVAIALHICLGTVAENSSFDLAEALDHALAALDVCAAYAVSAEALEWHTRVREALQKRKDCHDADNGRAPAATAEEAISILPASDGIVTEAEAAKNRRKSFMERAKRLSVLYQTPPPSA